MSDLSEKLDVVDRALERNLAWVAAADSKVPAIFAIDLAMLTVIFSLLPSVGKVTWLIGVPTSLAILALLYSLFCLALVAFPRLHGPKGSAVFFGGISDHHSEAQYSKKILQGITEELLSDLASQSYRNAEIARDKFSHIKCAMVSLFVAVLPWCVSVTVLYWLR